jgi:hypothetical protein
MSMARPEPEVQALIDELKGRKDLPAGALNAIQSTIESSPYLANAMAEAVRIGSLKHLNVMSDAHKAGDYDGKGTIRLEVGNFDPALRKPGQLRDNLAVVLGHETGHALMADASNRELYLLEGSIDQSLKQSVRNAFADGKQTTDPVNLTPEVSRYLEASRRNEGLAELVGMNALASRSSNGATGHFNREDFLRRVDPSTPCVDPSPRNGAPTLEQSIVLDKNGFQKTGGKIDSPAVNRVASCFFDEGVGLGPKGQSSYRDYYGADAMERVARLWKEQAEGTTKTLSPVELDMAKLKLDPQTVSKAGVELGQVGKSFEFYDTSQGKRELESVKQLHPTTPGHIAHHPRRDEAQDTPDNARTASRSLANQPGHSDFGSFEAIRTAVRSDGRWNDEQSENIAAALLREHKGDPVSKRLDEVKIGRPTEQGDTNIFAVYAPFGNKDPVFRTSVEAGRAAQEPAAQNLDKVEQLNLQQTQQAQLQQTMQQSPADPSQGGPRISR